MAVIKRHLGTITILVGDRQNNSKALHEVLSENGHLIMARMGVNVHRMCTEKCTAMMSLAVEGTVKEINDLTKKIDKLYGIVAKSNVMTK